MTILKKAAEEVWENTLVGKNGTFNMEQPNHYVSSPMVSEIQFLADDFKQSREEISESQKAKIVMLLKRILNSFQKVKHTND